MIKQLSSMLKVWVILLLTVLTTQAQYNISLLSGLVSEGIDANSVFVGSGGQFTYDSKGNLYVISGGNRVRKIDTEGKITTVAGNGNGRYSGDGGLAINAEIYGVSALTIDADDNLYIATWGRIRKVTATTGIITTIAGTGNSASSGDGGAATAAEVSVAGNLSFDAMGNLYFPEFARIRKIDKTTGIITTVAGTGAPGDTGDGGLATSAQVKSPRIMIFDASGNSYIVDSQTRKIRKIDANTGIITTIAGTGVSGFSGDGGLATSAQFKTPLGLAFDASGNLYIADHGNFRIRKIDKTTGVITTIAGNGVKPTSGSANGDGGLATAASVSCTYLFFDANNNLLFGDAFARRMRKIDMSTGIIDNLVGAAEGGGYIIASFSGDGGMASVAALNKPKGVALDASGNIYIADSANHRVRKVTAATGIISTIAGTGVAGFSGDGSAAISAQLNGPVGIAVDANNNVYFADRGNHRVRKIDGTTGNISTVAGTGSAGFSGDGSAATAAELNDPAGIALDANGNVYVSVYKNHRIRKIDIVTGNISTVAGNGSATTSGDGGLATSAGVTSPQGLTIDNAGNLYIAQVSAANSHIRKVDVATGIISTIAGKVGIDYNGISGDGGLATAAQLNLPRDVSVDANGNLYVLDSGHGRIRKIDATTGIINTIAGFGVLPFGNAWGFSTAEGNALKAAFNDPTGIFVDGQGSIYMADAGNSVLRKLTPATSLEFKQNTTMIASGGSHDFSSTALNATTQVDFTLSNTGAITLNLSNVTASGDFSIVGIPASSVATGSSTTITVAMNTSNAGAKTGTLTFTSNDLNTVTYTVNLTGTVTKADQTITFNLGTNAIKIVGDAAFDLSATGGASGNAITYASSNVAVATISGNTVTIVGPGTTTITASQSGNDNYNAATDVTQTLTVTQPTGLAENLANAQLTLFPVPTSDVINLSIKGKVSSGVINIQVLDRQGRMVMQSARRLQNGALTLPINNLASGYYLLRINIGEETILRRVVKK